MKERPILFNAEMVKAILSGRKTQTRRTMKVQPILNGNFYEVYGAGWSKGIKSVPAVYGHSLSQNCPIGAVGDQLWVRETWGVVSNDFDDNGIMIDWVPDRPATAIHEMPFGRGYYSGHAIYAADGSFTWGDDDGYEDGRSCWKPSIHMPRRASRIDLLITGVRIERLNDISEEDSRAEGVGSAVWFAAKGVPEDEWTSLGDHGALRASHINSFATLWESIYGEESWAANPWVWVIEFKRVAPAEEQP